MFSSSDTGGNICLEKSDHLYFSYKIRKHNDKYSLLVTIIHKLEETSQDTLWVTFRVWDCGGVSAVLGSVLVSDIIMNRFEK